MNIRSLLVLCFVFVAGLASYVYSQDQYVTHENRPCLTKSPGNGQGGCTQKGCHSFYDEEQHITYIIEIVGVTYKYCGSTEYADNCEEEPPYRPLCAKWFRYNSLADCQAGVGESIFRTIHSEKASCK